MRPGIAGRGGAERSGSGATPSIDSLAAAAMNPIGDPPGQDGGGFAGNGGNGGGKSGGRGRHRRARRDKWAAPARWAAAHPTDGASSGANGGRRRPRHRLGPGQRSAGRHHRAGERRVAGRPAGRRATDGASFRSSTTRSTRSTQTVQLKATFDNANGRLWAGQFTATSLHLFDEDGALVVPTQAIVNGSARHLRVRRRSGRHGEATGRCRRAPGERARDHRQRNPRG